MNSKIEALRAKKADGGFTLVELLIVVVVLGVLAGIAVFGVANFRESAVAQACETNTHMVEVAAAAYTAQTGGAPASGWTAAGYIDGGLPTGVTWDGSAAVAGATCGTN